MRKYSLSALVAAGLLAGGMSISSSTSAFAADLGGNCCADLEERIAELEATTARKGNRKVSLEISGFVNETLFVWDDGRERNAYVVTNEINPSRVRFKGEAKIANGFSAGYLLEFGVNGSRQDRTNQNDDNGAAPGVSLRHSAWYLSSKEYGKAWVGLTSDASDGISEITVANTGHFASPNISQAFGDGGSGFLLRRKDGVLSDVNFGDLVINGYGGTTDGHRNNIVKYETPTFAGFVGSASWGEDDLWNVGLRYAGEHAGFKFAAGIAYSENKDGVGANRRGATRPGEPDQDVQEWAGSASVIHTETGLFLTGAYGQLKDNNLEDLVSTTNLRNLADDTTDYLFVQSGIERKFFPIGKTTIFGEYFRLERGVALSGGGTVLTTSTLGGANTAILDSELEGYGVGVNPNLSDAVDLYVSYRHVSPDVTIANVGGAASPRKAAVEDFDYITTGAYIKF